MVCLMKQKKNNSEWSVLVLSRGSHMFFYYGLVVVLGLLLSVLFFPNANAESQSTDVSITTGGGFVVVSIPGNIGTFSCGINASSKMTVTHTYNTSVVNLSVVDLDYGRIRESVNFSLSCPNTSSVDVNMENITPLLERNNKMLLGNVTGWMAKFTNTKFLPAQQRLDDLVLERDRAVDALAGMSNERNQTRRDLDLSRFKLDTCESENVTYTWVMLASFFLVIVVVLYAATGFNFFKRGEVKQ